MTALSEVEIGPVPDGWEVRAIRNLCHIWSGGTPAKTEPAFWRGDIPWVSGKDLKSPQLDDSIDHISAEGLDAGSRLAPAGAVFILVRGMGLAKDLPVAVAKRPMAFNQDIKALVSRTGLSGSFLRSAIYHAKDRLLSRIVPSAHGTMTLNLDDVESLSILVPTDAAEAEVIASVLGMAQRAISTEVRQLEIAIDFKRAAMRELFTRGLRGEVQKETEIGLIPTSWSVVSMEGASHILSTKMKYSELLDRAEVDGDPSAHKVLGIKVADMARVGAEAAIERAELERYLSIEEAETRCAPPGVIVFPKNGAAVATNKKRLVAHWSVFDPNVMGLLAKDGVLQRYLFYWMQDFDLASIVKPGPVPHFNKSDLARVYIPVPLTFEEQHDIVAILDAVDRKINLHKRKRVVLEDLFKVLLHKLMTGEIRVGDLDLSALAPAANAEAAA